MAPTKKSKVEKHDIYKDAATALRAAAKDSGAKIPEHKEEKPYKLFGLFTLSNETCSKPWVRGLISAPAYILGAAAVGCLFSGIAAPLFLPLAGAAYGAAAVSTGVTMSMNKHLNQPKNEIDEILKGLEGEEKKEVLAKFAKDNPELCSTLKEVQQEENKEKGFFAKLGENFSKKTQKFNNYVREKFGFEPKEAEPSDVIGKLLPEKTETENTEEKKAVKSATPKSETETPDQAKAKEEAKTVAKKLSKEITPDELATKESRKNFAFDLTKGEIVRKQSSSQAAEH